MLANQHASRSRDANSVKFVNMKMTRISQYLEKVLALCECGAMRCYKLTMGNQKGGYVLQMGTENGVEETKTSGGIVNPDIDSAWFQAKLRDKNMSLSELARLLGVDKGTLSLRFNGKRHIRAAFAADLARVLGQPYTEVMKRAGVDMRGTRATTNEPQAVPLVGWIGGDGKVTIIDWKSREREFEVSGAFPSDSLCLQYRTTGSANDMYDGWLAVISPQRGPDDAEMLDRYCIVGLKGGAVVQRVVRRGYAPGMYTLVAPPAEPIHDAEIEWFSPVLAIMPV